MKCVFLILVVIILAADFSKCHDAKTLNDDTAAECELCEEKNCELQKKVDQLEKEIEDLQNPGKD